MDLRQFVGETLNQILAGVDDARKSTSIQHPNGNTQNKVNPKTTGGVSADRLAGHMTSSYGEAVHIVNFDVAITTEQSSDAKVGGGIRVAGIGIGSDLKAADKNLNVSRITFDVPIAYPND